MATIVTPEKANIFEEDISYRSAMSEEFLRKIAASINAINAGALVPIGTVEMSYLPVAKYQLLRTSAWVLCDGSNITTTDLGQFMLAQGLVSGSVFAPDMRGQVPVGINNGRSDGKQNTVVPGLGLGQQMGDGVKNHVHQGNVSLPTPGSTGANQFSMTLGSILQTNFPFTSNNNTGGQSQNTVNSVGVNWFIRVWNIPPT